MNGVIGDAGSGSGLWRGAWGIAVARGVSVLALDGDSASSLGSVAPIHGQTSP